MLYTFNELSLLHETSSLENACLILERFVKSCVEAKHVGLGDLRLSEAHIPSLYDIRIFQDYNIGTWLQDNRVNEDLRNRFKEILTSSPLIQSTEADQYSLFDQSEFKKNWKGKLYQVWGLGAAYLFDTLSISLATHPEWENAEIEIEHYYLNHDLAETTEKVFVKHFSSSENIAVHLAWWQAYQASSLAKSAELWERRNEFFPHLEFCEEVENQLNNLGVSKTLSQVIDRLRDLDQYVKGWKEGGFSYNDVVQTTSLNISPESDSTLRKYGTQRKFKIPGQGKKIFDLHIKTGDLRFHFYPDETSKKVYIGYIGKHLKIASEN